MNERDPAGNRRRSECGTGGLYRVGVGKRVIHKLHGMLWKCGKLNFRKLRPHVVRRP